MNEWMDKKIMEGITPVDEDYFRIIFYKFMEDDKVIPHFRIEQDVLSLLKISDYKKGQIFRSPFGRIKLDFKLEDEENNSIFKDIYLSQKEDGFVIYGIRFHKKKNISEICIINMDIYLNIKDENINKESVIRYKGKEYSEKKAIKELFYFLS